MTNLKSLKGIKVNYFSVAVWMSWWVIAIIFIRNVFENKVGERTDILLRVVWWQNGIYKNQSIHSCPL